MRVLVVAPVADRDSVGESWIAYQWAALLAERHEVTVLTYRQRSGHSLVGQLPKARVIEWLEPALVGRHERFNAMLNPGYIPFAWRAHRWIRKALRSGETFDVAHQVAPVSLRYPSPLLGTGIPYVIGPVGGSLASPPAFVEEEGGAPWFTALRSLDRFRLRWDPLLRRSFEQAACLIGIADYVGELLHGVRLRDFRTLSDIGILELPEPTPPSERTHGVKFLFVGRVIRTKGVRDAVRALQYLPRGLATLDVVGEGYDRGACEAEAVALGVQDLVRFHGRVPHEQVSEFYAGADVFLFPSYREAGGIVVVEAMAHGLPVIACAAGGPATSVDSASGLLVPAHDPEQFARDIAKAMSTLAGDPALRAEMARSARARMASIALWEDRVLVVEELYREILGRGRT